MPLFRRASKPSPGAVLSETADTSPQATGKGRPTPKRREAEGRRSGPPPPPPQTRKEAYARMREKSREQQTQARAGRLAGEDAHLLARDRGAARAAIRDLVDARRSIAQLLIPVAILLFLGSTPALPIGLRLAAQAVWYAFILALIVDWTLLGRSVARLVREQFPDDPLPRRSHIIYALMRSWTFRRLRNPKPRVKAGGEPA